MSVFVDTVVRYAMIERIRGLGTGAVGSYDRTVDLSSVGDPELTVADIQIAAGEMSTGEMDGERDWVEAFMVKAPQTVFTPSGAGLSHKRYQFTMWVKTDKVKGLFYNEALSGMIEEHFPNNDHIIRGHYTVTILKSYQQASITVDSKTGRLFNRVFVDCEIYYNNNK